MNGKKIGRWQHPTRTEDSRVTEVENENGDKTHVHGYVIPDPHVENGETVYIPAKAIEINGQMMVQLPHVDGAPDHMIAIHEEWFAQEEPVSDAALRYRLSAVRAVLDSPRVHGGRSAADPDGEVHRMVFVKDVEAALGGELPDMARPGPLRRKFDGGRGAMLDLSDRIVGYYNPPAAERITHDNLRERVYMMFTEADMLGDLDLGDKDNLAREVATTVMGLVYDVVSRSDT